MQFTIIYHGSTQYEQMVQLRLQLLRTPLGLHFDPAELEEEKHDVLIGAWQDSRLVGCCVLTPEKDGSLRLRQMAVFQELQGMGIGRALMQFAEETARQMGYSILVLHARKSAMEFYIKMGYQAKGAEFIEVTIPHYAMEKKL